MPSASNPFGISDIPVACLIAYGLVAVPPAANSAEGRAGPGQFLVREDQIAWLLDCFAQPRISPLVRAHVPRSLARLARDLHSSNPARARVIEALNGNICRCCGYGNILKAAQRAAHMERMRELTAVKTAKGADLATVLSADYALNHLDADLRWMTTTAARLTTLTAEVDAA